MSKSSKKKNKISNQSEKKKIAQGRVSALNGNINGTITPSVIVTRDLLTELSSASFRSKYDAVDILVDKTPFGGMALNVYTTLTNPSGKYVFKNPQTGKKIKRASLEKEFEAFCSKRWGNDDSGIDGVYEVMLRHLYTRGGMAYEIVVSEDAKSIDAIIVIDPKTFQSFEELSNDYRYAIYQKRTDGKKIDLYTGNFFYYPYQPKDGTPQGTVPFEPAIVPSIDYYQHASDQTTILNRIGYPRYSMELDDEAILEVASPSEKQTFEQRNELFDSVFDTAESRLRGIQRDSDLVYFKSNKIDIIGGGVNGSGIDLRAWVETDYVAIANGYSLPKIYLNMEKGGSYALGAAEQESLIERIKNGRDNIISIKENIANMFLRVSGYNAVCTFEADPIDWEDKVKKWTAKNKELEFYVRLGEKGLLDPNKIANLMTGEDKAFDFGKFYENLYYTADVIGTVQGQETNTDPVLITEE